MCVSCGASPRSSSAHPDTATPEDIRRFQVHQAESGVQPQSIELLCIGAALLLFTVTLDRPDLSRRFVIVRLPSEAANGAQRVEEVGRLLEVSARAEAQGCSRTAYGAGLRVSEVATLKVSDIDSTRMLIRVETQGKGRA